jgi:hypothetical protein
VHSYVLTGNWGKLFLAILHYFISLTRKFNV